MHNALTIFESNIQEARHLTALHQYLVAHMQAPIPFDDLLRSQIVYAVGAFDKLLHDVIRIGMVETFSGTRQPTPKYSTEPITLAIHHALVGASLPPPELVFEAEVVKKLGRYTFQHPDPVVEGLALIWAEPHKWDAIAAAMGLTKTVATTKLKLIVSRRNAIVHEADMHPLTNQKSALNEQECREMTDFLEACGRAIVGLVV